MAVITYSTTNVSFSTFDTWSNNGYTNDTNINLSSVLTDAFPADNGAPYSVSELYNRSWFYGTVQKSSLNNAGNADSFVELTAPYSVGQTVSPFTVKNVDYSVYSTVTLVATTGYLVTFLGWYDADTGGTQLSTNTTLSLTSANHTGVTAFYARFQT